MWALVLLVLLNGMAVAQSATANLYNQANGLYNNGQFEAARDRYRQVVEYGVEDARLFYNLGNAHFKAGELGQAILWYERALRLAPRDDDIEANLRFANLVKQDRDPEEGNLVWRFLIDAFFFPSLNELCLSFSFLFLILFILGIRRMWSRMAISAGGLVLIAACLGLTVLDGIYLGMRIYHEETVEEGIIVADQGTARSGPGEEQTTVFVVHEGTKVRIARRQGDWLLVRLTNGLGGWLPGVVVEAI
jgi:hypothetical protein